MNRRLVLVIMVALGFLAPLLGALVFIEIGWPAARVAEQADADGCYLTTQEICP